MKKAVVLSGGGALGSYQVGVWRALRKIGYRYDIVTGTSVGSLNGAFMTTGEYLKLLFIWKHVKYEQVFDKQLDEKELLATYAKGILEGGMEVKNLEKNLKKFLNASKFYRSKVDYGLVTVNYPSLKPISLTKKEINKDKLHDFLIASSTCFPLFQKKDIDGKTFIDGGYFDVLPINLAIDMGATEIIAVDLKALGIRRKVKNKNVKITYIEPRNDIGSFMIFSREQAKRGLLFGYHDAMKTFGKLDGDKFTFKKGQLEKLYNKHHIAFKFYMDKLIEYQQRHFIERILLRQRYSKILKAKDEDTIKKQFFETLEYLGKVFKLDESLLYDINTYNDILLDKLELLEDLDQDLIEQKIKDLDIKDLFNTKWIIKYLIMNMMDEEKRKKINTLTFIFQKEYIAALYLITVKP